MVRQVIDITTPEENEGEEQFPAVLASAKAQKVFVQRKKEPARHAETSEFKKRNRVRISFSFPLPRISLKLPFVIIVAVAVLAIVFLILTWQTKLALRIMPVSEPIKMDEEVQVSLSQGKIDLEKRIIPGQLIEAEQEKWQTFKATGKELEQGGASGVIFVYNNINPPIPLVLKEGTRFLSSKDGKIYKAKSKVSLPPAILKDGKITASITEVAVVAQKQGEEYNIEPAKFSVPGLAGTALYYSIWAESREKIEGGFGKQVNKITQADLENSQSSLVKALKEAAKSSLQAQVAEGFAMDAQVIVFEEPDFNCSQAEGEKIEEFNCYGKIKAKAVVFKSEDLSAMAQNFVSSVLSSEKKLYKNSLIISTSPKGAISESGNLVLNLKVEAKLYKDVNQQRLIADVAGKSQKNIQNLIKSDYPQIEKTVLKFWPFWARKAPKNLEKIKLEVVFN